MEIRKTCLMCDKELELELEYDSGFGERQPEYCDECTEIKSDDAKRVGWKSELGIATDE